MCNLQRHEAGSGRSDAHEICHVMGCGHDDRVQSDCASMTDKVNAYVMSPDVRMAISSWPSCNRKSMKEFLEHGLGDCLLNEFQDHNFQTWSHDRRDLPVRSGVPKPRHCVLWHWTINQLQGTTLKECAPYQPPPADGNRGRDVQGNGAGYVKITTTPSGSTNTSIEEMKAAATPALVAEDGKTCYQNGN
jgi:hypothetical protein